MAWEETAGGGDDACCPEIQTTSTGVTLDPGNQIVVTTNAVPITIIPSNPPLLTDRETVVNSGSSTVTIDPPGAVTINGFSTIVLQPRESVSFIGDGTNWIIDGTTSLAYIPEGQVQSGFAVFTSDVNQVNWDLETLRAAFVQVTGLTTARTQDIDLPLVGGTGVWLVYNNNAYNLTLREASGLGTTVLLLPYETAFVRSGNGAEIGLVKGPSNQLTQAPLWFETLAEATATVPNVDSTAFIIESGASYFFDTSESSTANGWSILGAGTGRWIIKSDTIYIRAIGGGADDGVRINTLYAAVGTSGVAPAQAVGKGIKVVHCAGVEWTIDTTLLPYDQLNIEWEAGCSINCTMSTVGFSEFLYRKFQTVTALTTLASVAVVGSNQLSLSATPTDEQWISVGGGASTTYLKQQFQVKAISGAGPYTVTLDDVVQFAFPSGDTVQNLTDRPYKINIKGNGTKIRGTCSRLFEFNYAYDCHVEGFEFVPGSGAPTVLGSMDNASRNSGFRKCFGNFQGETAGYGFLLESAINCYLEICGAAYASNAITFWDAASCRAYLVWGEVCTNSGLLMTSNTMTFGCFNCTVNSAHFDKGSNLGAGLGYVTDCTLQNVTCDTNVVGVDIGSGAVAATRTRLVSCKTARCSTYGVQVRAAAIGTRLIGYKSLSDVRSLAPFSGLSCSDFDLKDFTGSGVHIDATIAAKTMLDFKNGTIASSLTGSLMIDKYGPSVDTWDCIRFECNTAAANSSVLFYRAAALGCSIFKDCIGTQASACNGLYLFGGGNTLRLEGRNDFSAMAAPYTITAGSYCSHFTQIVSTGALQAVAFPDVKVGEWPRFTRVLNGGVPGIEPLVAYVANTGWNVTWAAADTSTYEMTVCS